MDQHGRFSTHSSQPRFAPFRSLRGRALQERRLTSSAPLATQSGWSIVGESVVVFVQPRPAPRALFTHGPKSRQRTAKRSMRTDASAQFAGEATPLSRRLGKCGRLRTSRGLRSPDHTDSHRRFAFVVGQPRPATPFTGRPRPRPGRPQGRPHRSGQVVDWSAGPCRWAGLSRALAC